MKLNVLETQGSLDNLQRLEDPNVHVDVGFVQGGMTSPGAKHDDLMSLGSVSYVPLAVVLSRAGGCAPVGTQGAPARDRQRGAAAPARSRLTLLKANGIEPGGDTELLSLSGDDAASALMDGRIDAAFLTGDSAQPPTMAKLSRTPGVHFFDFTQAEAYARRFPYLSVISLPMGAFDFAKNTPPHAIELIAPTARTRGARWLASGPCPTC